MYKNDKNKPRAYGNKKKFFDKKLPKISLNPRTPKEENQEGGYFIKKKSSFGRSSERPRSFEGRSSRQDSFKPRSFEERPERQSSFKSRSFEGKSERSNSFNNRPFEGGFVKKSSFGEKRDSSFKSSSSSFSRSSGSSEGRGFGERSSFSRSSSGGRFGGSTERSSSGFGGRKSFGSRPSFGGKSGGGKKRRGQYIDPAMFVHKPSDFVVKKIEIKHTFADFDFDKIITDNLKKKNYTNPTPIQDQTISHALQGRDVLGLATTGSGKTAAFLLPLLTKIAKDRNQKVLIIAPTRELAMQINEELRSFSFGMKIFSTVCVGGMPIFRQISDLKKTNHFVIGTPGRLKDLEDRKVINFANFHNIVLDEVDHMLDMGFVEDIQAIIEKLPVEKQALFFSATMPPKIRELANRILKDPIVVDIQSGSSAKHVEQDVIRARPEEKLDKLDEVLKGEDANKILIFTETKREAEKLSSALEGIGHRNDYLHGDKKQSQRKRTLDAFKSNKFKVLIATDVAARGIDVKDISHVINYTQPQTYEDYVHRIGRTGRGQKSGKALTFI